MKTIIVDDESLSLQYLESELRSLEEITEISTFLTAETALEWAKKNIVDIALLDMELGEIRGIELAKRVNELHPNCKIIFVTGHQRYAVEAFELHASGYLLKPIRKEELQKEIRYAMKNISLLEHKERVVVQCFGNFEVFYMGKPLRFQYRKTKELFAYLVDRRGAICDINTLCAIIWEDKPDSVGLRSRLRHLISDLKNTLQEISNEQILVRHRGGAAILPNEFECDYYRWMEGNEDRKSVHNGEYMAQYSWAEKRNGYLCNRPNNKEI